LDDTDLKWTILLALAILVAGVLWYFRDDILPPPEVPSPATESAQAEPEPVTTEPLHPIEPLTMSPAEGELVELPPLDESDSYFALELIALFGSELEALLDEEGLIDKSVATVDNLDRARVAEKIRPLGRISGSFVVTGKEPNGPYYLSPENFSRYDSMVNMLAGADVDEMVGTYRRFYPLIQEAFTRLGYPDAYFNDRLIAIIDQLLETPVPEQPVQLVRPHVLYEFADPDLEALSSGQKLLIRMGNDHASRVKARLTALREQIAQPAG
jgi:hypothetical protein